VKGHARVCNVETCGLYSSGESFTQTLDGGCAQVIQFPSERANAHRLKDPAFRSPQSRVKRVGSVPALILSGIVLARHNVALGFEEWVRGTRSPDVFVCEDELVEVRFKGYTHSKIVPAVHSPVTVTVQLDIDDATISEPRD